MRRLVAITVVSAWALMASLPGVARAEGGDLDPTFNSNGKLTTTFAEGEAQARGIAIQPDGKIVVAGTVGSDFGLTRYLSDGALDTAFDGDGRVVTDVSGEWDAARGVAVQTDGKIVAVGIADEGGADPTFAVVRYDVDDGLLDPGFGSGGVVTTNFSSGEDRASAVAIQGNGKIVVAGTRRGRGFALARYTSVGELDTTFGEDGLVTTRFHTLGIAYGVGIQADGKIVAVGTGATDGGFALARYRHDGSLDPTFGRDGKVLTYLADGYGGEAHAVAVQSNGKIVIAGAVDSIFGPFAVARYTSRGRLDPTFGGDGIVTTDMGTGEEAAWGVAIQENGKIVVAGYADVPHETESTRGGFALARYRRKGRLDDTFGGDGKVRTRFQAGVSLAVCVAIQGNGKIVAAGWVAGRFAVARYLP